MNDLDRVPLLLQLFPVYTTGMVVSVETVIVRFYYKSEGGKRNNKYDTHGAATDNVREDALHMQAGAHEGQKVRARRRRRRYERDTFRTRRIRY